MKDKNNHGPSVGDFNYDDATVEAHGYFFHELPPSISGNPVENLSPAQEQYERLRLMYAERANEAVADEVSSRVESRTPDSSPEDIASMVDDFGVEALEAGKKAGGREAKESSRAIALEAIAAPGNQPDSSERIAGLSDENIARLLRAKDGSSSSETTPEVIRELEREESLRKINKIASEARDLWHKEDTTEQLNEIADIVNSLETPDDQIRATFEAMCALRHEGDPDGMAGYATTPRQAILSPILKKSKYQADLIQNYLKLEPAPMDFLTEEKILDCNDGLLEDIVHIRDVLDDNSHGELADIMRHRSSDFKVPNGTLVKTKAEDFTERDTAILDVIVDRGEEQALKYLSAVDEGRQADYLRSVATTPEDSPLSALSNPYLFDIDVEGIKIPFEEVQKIANESGLNGSYLMMHLAKSGYEGVDRNEAVGRMIELTSQIEDYDRAQAFWSASNFIAKDIEKRSSSLPLDAPRGEVLDNILSTARENRDYLRAACDAALETDSAEILLSSITTSQVNVFKEIFEEAGIDPLELYRSEVGRVSAGGSHSLHNNIQPQSQLESFYSTDEIDYDLASGYFNAALATASENSIMSIAGSLGPVYDTRSTDSWSRTPIDNGIYGRLQEVFPREEIAGILTRLGRVGLVNEMVADKFSLFEGLEDDPEMVRWNLDALDSRNIISSDFARVAGYLRHPNSKRLFDQLSGEDKGRYQEFQRLDKLTSSVMMSAGITREGYYAIQELEALDEVPLYLQELGVTELGDKGMEQLRSAVREIIAEYQDVDLSDESMRKLAHSPFHQSIFYKIYRCDIGEYYNQATRVSDMVDYLSENAQSIEPLNPEFESMKYSVRSVGETSGEVQVSSTTREIFKDRANEILSYQDESDSVRVIAEMSNELESLRSEIQDLLDSIDSGQNEKYEAITDERKRHYFRLNEERKLHGAMHAINYIEQGGNDAVDIFELVSGVDELHPSVRKLATFESVAGLSELEQLKLRKNVQSSEDLSLSNLTALKSFMEITGSSSQIDDKKLRKKYRSLFNTKFIDDEISRLRKLEQAGIKVSEFEFIPTRGIGMEFSGQLSDACWAGVYDSIAEEFPKLTSVVFRRNSSNPDHTKLVGSMMLIEGETETGEKALIVRGINPIENQSTKMNTDDFVDSVADYVRQMADKIGAKPAIVFDGPVGSATTNRPLILESVAELVEPLDRMDVKRTLETTFNYYDLEGIVYSLDS